MQHFVQEFVRHFFEHKWTWLVPVAAVMLIVLLLVALAPDTNPVPILFKAH